MCSPHEGLASLQGACGENEVFGFRYANVTGKALSPGTIPSLVSVKPIFVTEKPGFTVVPSERHDWGNRRSTVDHEIVSSRDHPQELARNGSPSKSLRRSTL